MTAFESAMSFTLSHEKGYANDPRDHGGATLDGVTQAAYDAYRKRHQMPSAPVREMTTDERDAIYYLRYWGPSNAAAIAPQRPVLAACHFDWAFNHGFDGAARTLQLALNDAGASPPLTVDGAIGAKTIAACDTLPESVVIMAYLKRRAEWYRHRVETTPDQGVFLTGWLNRVRAFAVMAGVATDPAYAAHVA